MLSARASFGRWDGVGGGGQITYPPIFQDLAFKGGKDLVVTNL